jgi:hypothetical protein
MSPELIFKIGNSIILVGWFLLLVFPNYKYTQTIIMKGLILIFSIVYAFLILKNFSSFDFNSFGSLNGVRALFQNDEALTAGWFHYLAFDLFVGAYIVRNGIKIGMPRWQYSIPLPFTFMLGPIGYLIFTLIKMRK